MPRIAPTFTEEQRLRGQGFLAIAGLDEVGYGALAGPVYAGAVILPPDPDLFEGVRDSKMLAAGQREEMAARIHAHAVAWAVGVASVEDIAGLNVLHAARLAMKRALAGLAVPADAALIDGNPIRDFPVPSRSVVGGDATVLSIAAASVIAKVARDRLMAELSLAYPAYGFAEHKGYGTPAHLAALRIHGPCPLHRMAYAPVREAANLVKKAAAC